MSGLGEKIRAERQKRNISQSELSRQVKTPRTHIVAIEKGRRGIGLNLLNRISVVLGVQVNFFLDKAQAEQASSLSAEKKPRVRQI